MLKIPIKSCASDTNVYGAFITTGSCRKCHERKNSEHMQDVNFNGDQNEQNKRKLLHISFHNKL